MRQQNIPSCNCWQPPKDITMTILIMIIDNTNWINSYIISLEISIQNWIKGVYNVTWVMRTELPFLLSSEMCVKCVSQTHSVAD